MCKQLTTFVMLTISLLVQPLLLSSVFAAPSPDFDEDGVIGFPEFLIFVDNFGKEVSSGGTPVAIPDANLRAVIEDNLGKERGAPITRGDMSTLARLDAPNANISDLTGLEYAIRLTRLDLINNSISDIAPLSGLTSLESLNLGHNSVSDVSALSELTSLEGLYLPHNNISDIAPLVANMGLSSGDEVDVTNNPLSATSINIHIPALRGRGVTMWFGVSKPVVEKIERDLIPEDWEARTPPPPTGSK